MSQFASDIKFFNNMYNLPGSDTPTLEVGVPVVERLTAFKSILTEELNEIDSIIEKIKHKDKSFGVADAPAPSDLEILTDLADLLGDIQVYCASEMRKFGLDLDPVLAIIMSSNFSKLGVDGKPIYDERGKVQKGPNYWKPEPKISLALSARIVAGISLMKAQELQAKTDEAWKQVQDAEREFARLTVHTPTIITVGVCTAACSPIGITSETKST